MGRKKLTLADGTVVEFYDWVDFHAANTGVVQGADHKVLLFDDDVFPADELLITGFKVDTEVPSERLANIWIHVVMADVVYQYVCTAFDAMEPRVRIDKEPYMGEPFELVVKTDYPRLRSPMLKLKNDRCQVFLCGRRGLSRMPDAAVTVTLFGLERKPQPTVGK